MQKLKENEIRRFWLRGAHSLYVQQSIPSEIALQKRRQPDQKEAASVIKCSGGLTADEGHKNKADIRFLNGSRNERLRTFLLFIAPGFTIRKATRTRPPSPPQWNAPLSLFKCSHYGTCYLQQWNVVPPPLFPHPSTLIEVCGGYCCYSWQSNYFLLIWLHNSWIPVLRTDF